MRANMQVALRGKVGSAIFNYLRYHQARWPAIAVSTWRAAVADSDVLSPRAKRRYMSAIQPVPIQPGIAPLGGRSAKVFKLAQVSHDYVTRLLEDGWKRFDMKPGLLRGARSGGPHERRVIPLQGKSATAFRTVSSKSPPSSWWHPGFPGAHVVPAAREMVRKLILEALR